MHALIELEQKLRLRQRQLPAFISRSFIVVSSCFSLILFKVCRANVMRYLEAQIYVI